MEERKSFGFFLPLLILVVLAILGYFFLGRQPHDERMMGKNDETSTIQNEGTDVPPQELPAASGNIDETTAAIILQAAQDPALSSEDLADAALVTIDDDTIISFGQAYDETGI